MRNPGTIIITLLDYDGLLDWTHKKFNYSLDVNYYTGFLDWQNNFMKNRSKIKYATPLDFILEIKEFHIERKIH